MKHLLQLCVEMQDYESLNFGKYTNSLELYPSLFEYDTLQYALENKISPQVTSFIFDNLLQSYIYEGRSDIEEYIQDKDFILDIKAKKDRFARRYQFDNFFEFYVHTRGYIGVQEVALSHLKNTENTYVFLLKQLFGKDTIDFDTASLYYTQFLHNNFNNFPSSLVFEKVDTLLGRILDEDLATNITINIIPEIEVTHNKLTINPLHSELNVALQDGFETYKSIFHAIGHALYPFLVTNTEKLLSSDISDTESLAFLIQKICSERVWVKANKLHVDSQFYEQSMFFDLYFERLYCIKILFENNYYSNHWKWEEYCTYYEKISLKYLKISQKVESPIIDFKPNSCEFIFGYMKYNAIYDKLNKTNLDTYLDTLSTEITKHYR